MSRIAYVNGAYVRQAAAHISVLDRAFLFADGVYEVFLVMNGAMVDAKRHFDRLDRSLLKLQIAAPMARAPLTIVLRELIARNRLQFGAVYLQITRGAPGQRDHIFPRPSVRPTIVALTRPANAMAADAQAARGIAVITTTENRWAGCDIKSTALLPNVLAKQAAFEAGAGEAWFVDADGLVTEGASSNAWIVNADGVLQTRSLDANILPGVTRASLIALLAEQQIAILEKPFSVADAHAAREAFNTSAMAVVMPVVRLDGRPVGDGAPGPIATALRARYKAFATQNSAG